MKAKKLYTTGEVSRVLGLSQQAVIRFVDGGEMEGFRIPGSQHRRITHAGLVEFVKCSEIPDAVLKELEE